MVVFGLMGPPPHRHPFGASLNSPDDPPAQTTDRGVIWRVECRWGGGRVGW